MSRVDLFLGALRNHNCVIRKHGKNFRADCPNGHSSRGSLSISDSAAGGVLVRCFAGCTPEQITGAIGLRLADLMPERITDYSPEGRRTAAIAFKQSSWFAALELLAYESTVVCIAAHDLSRGAALTSEMHNRLSTAEQRIQSAKVFFTNGY